MANPLAQASGMPQSMQQPSGIAELGSGWRCVKSEDYGQTYIFGGLRGNRGMPTCASPALLLCMPPASAPSAVRDSFLVSPQSPPSQQTRPPQVRSDRSPLSLNFCVPLITSPTLPSDHALRRPLNLTWCRCIAGPVPTPWGPSYPMGMAQVGTPL
jgi:hypothetical protein